MDTSDKDGGTGMGIKYPPPTPCVVPWDEGVTQLEGGSERVVVDPKRRKDTPSVKETHLRRQER